MDITEFFRRGFQNLHQDLLDKNYKKKSLLARKESLKDARRETRNTIFFNHRNIDINMSPLTPAVAVKKPALQAAEKKENKRLDMLKEWKDKRNKRKLEEMKKAKPIFKVCHVETSVGLPNLENVNKVIKGKAIKFVSKVNSFPFKKLEFVPPKHIKPMYFINAAPKENAKNKVNKNEPSTSGLLNKGQPNNGTNIISKKMVLRSGVNKVVTKKPTNNFTTRGLKVLSPINKKQTSLRNSPQEKPGKKCQRNTYKPKVPISQHNKTLGKCSSSQNNKTPDKTSSSKNNKTLNVSSLQNIQEDYEDPQFVTPINNKLPLVTPQSGKKSQRTRHAQKVSNSQSTKILEKASNLQNKKTLNKASSSQKIQEEYEAPQFVSPTNNKIPPVIPQSDVIVIEDSGSEETVITYQDVEVTMKTPIKKKQTPKPASRPLSARKSLRRRDSCILCLDSPINQNLTSETPKTPTSSGKRKSLKMKPIVLLDPTEVNKYISNYNELENSDIEKETIEQTPDSKKQEIVYISPFITISRGKNSARKEYHERKLAGGTFKKTPDGRDLSSITSPDAGANYFERKLEDEITRIQGLCDVWQTYKEERNAPEETTDMIDVAIGQSNLLISKKFEQFRSLIAQCKTNEYEEKPITCEDLHGFWDMIYQQVVDLDKRFNNLQRLKDNNWEEILPPKKIVHKRGRNRPKTTTAATSSLKEMIKVARNKKKEQINIDIQILAPKTPENIKKTPTAKSSSVRRSLRMSVLQIPNSTRISSPGLIMSKITQAIKMGDGLTPNKSILKRDSVKTDKSLKKSVLFVDGFEESVTRKALFSPEEKENESLLANLNQNLDNTVPSVRRSKRINLS